MEKIPGLVIFTNRIDAGCLKVRTKVENGGKAENYGRDDPLSLVEWISRLSARNGGTRERTPILKPVRLWYEKKPTRRANEV